MSRLLPSLLSLLLLSSPAIAESFTVSAEEWARPRSGENLARLPALVGVMQAFEREPDGAIVIAHATGETGQLWAEELRSWLVALGVASTRLRLDARTELKDALVLNVRPRNSL